MPDRTPQPGDDTPDPLTAARISGHAAASAVVAGVEQTLRRVGISIHDDDVLLEEYRARERDGVDLLAALSRRGITTLGAFDTLLAETPAIEPALAVFQRASLGAGREPGGTIEDLLTIVVFLLRPATRDEVEQVYGEPTAGAIMRAVAAT